VNGRRGSTTRIGVQSTDRLRRETLAAYLETLPAFSVVGRVADYDDVVSLCALQRPAVMLLDAADEVTATATVCRLLRRQSPDTCLAVLYESTSADGIGQLREAGVDAVVPYSHGLDAVVAVLERLAHGLPSALSEANGLSARQREILLLLASGHSAIEIAALLGISAGTVENHKRRIYAKLGATSAVQAIARAAAFGIINRKPGGEPPDGFGGTPWRDVPWNDSPDRRTPGESGRPLLVLAVGGRREPLDRVVATLIAHRLPVVRDHWPSWIEQSHGVRSHRGPVVRVLVDPAPDHWRVGAIAGRAAIVVHSGPIDHALSLATLASGGAAVVPVDQVEDRLVPVLDLVARGYVVMDWTFSRPVVQLTGKAQPQPALTAREYDILRAIGRSYSVRQTARCLGIAVKTVENTQGHLYRKLGVRNRAGALTAAYSLGLLHPR